jgi:SAM-dependent methyltransferase
MAGACSLARHFKQNSWLLLFPSFSGVPVKPKYRTKSQHTKSYGTKPDPKPTKTTRVETSWDPLARWYDGWVGPHGSRHHRELAIPAALELLDLQRGEHLLDIGAGQGVLAPYVDKLGAHYLGLEVSRALLKIARQRHQGSRFILGDACKLREVVELREAQFDAAVFMLSIQDIDPLAEALASASWALKAGGRLVILMTHPCFRVPRQSGWGWDEQRKLRYRRIDRYLTPLAVPMKAYPGREGVSKSFHRPLVAYVNGLGANGLLVDRISEIAGSPMTKDTPETLEIPLFMGLRGRKVG